MLGKPLSGYVLPPEADLTHLFSAAADGSLTRARVLSRVDSAWVYCARNTAFAITPAAAMRLIAVGLAIERHPDRRVALRASVADEHAAIYRAHRARQAGLRALRSAQP